MKRLGVSVVLMVLVTASSCGRREVPGSSGTTTNPPNARTAMSERKPGRAERLTQALDVNLSAALKHIDDFSAAMGLQYARLSYDTNRYLLQYAQIIPRLSDEEFMDLVRDFFLARGGTASAEEVTYLRQCLGTRMKQSWEAGNYDAYSTYLVYVLETLEYNQRTTELTPLFDQAIAYAYTAFDDNKKSKAVDAVLATADMVGVACGLLADEALANHYGRELTRLSAMPGVTERIQCALLMRAACGKLHCAPAEAQAEFEAILRRWPEGLDNSYYYMTEAYVEGLKKGLTGAALGDYVYDYVAARHQSKR